MPKCWKVVGLAPFTYQQTTYYACAESQPQVVGNFPKYLRVDGNTVGPGWEAVQSITETSRGNCTNCGAPIPLRDDQPYDCLNGECLPSVVYGTPGIFTSRGTCESGCAKNSDCTGECVSAEEIAALQQAANNLRGRLCG